MYCGMLSVCAPDDLRYTTTDSMAQVLHGGLEVDVTKVDLLVQRLVPIQTGGHGRPEVTSTPDR